MELSRLMMKKKGVYNRAISDDEKRKCQEEAKKMVCEVGVSMYKFLRRFSDLYHKAIEYDAIHETVNNGRDWGFLEWSSPRRFDYEKGKEWRNIVLTEEGFKLINEPTFRKVMNIYYLFYVSEPIKRRRP